MIGVSYNFFFPGIFAQSRPRHAIQIMQSPTVHNVFLYTFYRFQQSEIVGTSYKTHCYMICYYEQKSAIHVLALDILKNVLYVIFLYHSCQLNPL